MSAEPKDRAMLMVTLVSDEEARKFMRASEEIELMMDDTIVQMINFADYIEGEPPPANESPNAGKWCLIGTIRGPLASTMPDSDKEPGETAWAKAVIEILEDHELIADKEGIPN